MTGTLIIVYDVVNATDDSVVETYYGDFATVEDAREGWETVKSLEPRADNARLCQVVEVLTGAAPVRTREDCSTQLRGEGYVHAHSNRYARTKDKGRGVTWAAVHCDERGHHTIEYL